MSGPSLRGAIDAKCRDCGGQDGGERHWRVHVSACPVTTCALWSVRPLARRTLPSWLTSRVPGDLPEGFLALPNEDAIANIRSAGELMNTETATISPAEPVEEAERVEKT